MTTTITSTNFIRLMASSTLITLQVHTRKITIMGQLITKMDPFIRTSFEDYSTMHNMPILNNIITVKHITPNKLIVNYLPSTDKFTTTTLNCNSLILLINLYLY